MSNKNEKNFTISVSFDSFKHHQATLKVFRSACNDFGTKLHLRTQRQQSISHWDWQQLNQVIVLLETVFPTSAKRLNSQ
jgi:hypothetical protein